MTEKRKSKTSLALQMVAPLNKNLVLIKIGHECISALLDTGSTITAVKQSLLPKINAQSSQIKPSDGNLIRDAAGTKHVVSGVINLTMCIGGMEINHNFYVIPSLMQNVVLGLDLMKKTKAFIDFS